MSIPANMIVNITPRVISAGGQGLAITGLFLTENPILPVGVVKEFTSSTLVGDYFGTTSTEYAAALIYFAGYNGSFKKPARIKFARRVKTAQGAFLRGAKFTGSLQSLNDITSGALSITIDGTLVALTNIDFSAATSLSQVAEVLETKLSETVTGVAVTYSPLTKAFQINSPTVGEGSNITYAELSPLASLLNLTGVSGAVISPWSEALSPFDAMAQIFAKDANFVTFTTLYATDVAESVGLNSWAMSKYVAYLYVPWTQDVLALNPDNVSDLAPAMQNAAQTNFAPCFGDYRLSAGVMGTIASIDWQRLNGSIDVAFKQVNGLTPTCSSEADAATLSTKGYNYYGDFASRGEQFNFIYKGTIIGDYINIATFINAVWLNEYIQSALLNGLESIGKVPYNDTGYSLIRSWVSDPISSAINNGVIQTGVELSTAQKAQVMQEAGDDITPDLYSNGYYLQILDPGTAARETSESPIITLWYTDGGAVKKLQVASTVLL